MKEEEAPKNDEHRHGHQAPLVWKMGECHLQPSEDAPPERRNLTGGATTKHLTPKTSSSFVERGLVLHPRMRRDTFNPRSLREPFRPGSYLTGHEMGTREGRDGHENSQLDPRHWYDRRGVPRQLPPVYTIGNLLIGVKRKKETPCLS